MVLKAVWKYFLTLPGHPGQLLKLSLTFHPFSIDFVIPSTMNSIDNERMTATRVQEHNYLDSIH